MSISNFLRNMFWAVLLGGCVLSHQGEAADTRKCAAPQRTVDSTYSPWQVWSYKTRPSEGVIVHVRIDGVQFKNCKGGPAPTTIDHAPFTKIAMDKSVSRQLRTVSELPEFEAGYKDWLAHCGGVYTVSVAEMVDVNDATFNAGLGCKT
jgi:hypothetical protein